MASSCEILPACVRMPIRQPHVGLATIRASSNDLCSCLPGDGSMHLVLHGLVKIDAGLGRRAIIEACSVDVRNLLIKTALRRPNVLNPA